MNLLIIFLCALQIGQAQSALKVTSATKDKVILEWDLKDTLLENLGTIIATPFGSTPTYTLLEAETLAVSRETEGKGSTVEFGKPMIMRDFRLVPVVVHPFVKGNRNLFLKKGKVEIDLGAGEYLSLPGRPPSLSFYPLYRSVIANFEEISPPINNYIRGSFLIVTHDSFYDAAEELAQWKTEEGWKTVVVKLSDIGQNPTNEDIRAFVQNAYETWDTPPDFLLLFGDVDLPFGGGLPTFTYGLNATDRPYGLMEGNDVLPEILVGRIAVDFPYEAEFAVEKTIAYEKTPYTGETNWYRRALLSAGVYYHNEIVNTTRLTKLWAMEKLLSLGYQADTVIGYQIGGGGSTQDVLNSLANGVAFVNYRGWSNTLGWVWPQFLATHVMNQLNNGWKMPVMFSITCGTGNFAASTDPSFGEAWIRAWDAVNNVPRGGPAVFAPSDPNTHTRWNNAIDVGLMSALLDEKIELLGPLTLSSFLKLYYFFPDTELMADSIESYFYVYNIQGDPALKVWTDVPHNLIVNLPSSIPLGPYALSVSVTDQTGSPLPEDAFVQISKGEEIYEGKNLYPSGSCEFSFETLSEGTLKVVVTGRNLKPYIAEIPVIGESHNLGLESYNLSDENGDGNLNPGEQVDFWPSIKNTGTVVESLVEVRLIKITNGIKTTDSLSYIGTISPGETGDAQTPFTFLVDSTVEDSDIVALTMEITANSGSYPAYLEIPVVAPRVVFDTLSWDDPSGNGIIDPGETANLYITLRNLGRFDFPGGTARLTTGMSGVQIEQNEIPFPQIVSGSFSQNSIPWVVSLPEDFTPGREVPFELFLNGGKIKLHINLLITLGEAGIDAPTGPDSYGYWAYDTKDTVSGLAPTYNWVETDPNYGGSGTYLTSGYDSLFTFILPFTFEYYGEEVETVTVSTNGWLSFSNTVQFSPRNWPIPSPFGPPNLVAPFWDELMDTGGGGVYGLYNEDDHSYIIEWSRVWNKYRDSLETFEVTLFDPAYTNTPTGDGEILFQYQTVNNVDQWHYYATVGIENYDHSIGLGYVYGLFYPATAETLRDELAILFTTIPPDTYSVNRKELPVHSSRKKEAFLFPNPFKNQLKLAVPLTHSGKIGISLYDVSGRCLLKTKKGPYSEGYHYIDLDEVGNLGLKKGIYFLKVNFAKKKWLFKILREGK